MTMITSTTFARRVRPQTYVAAWIAISVAIIAAMLAMCPAAGKAFVIPYLAMLIIDVGLFVGLAYLSADDNA